MLNKLISVLTPLLIAVIIYFLFKYKSKSKLNSKSLENFANILLPFIVLNAIRKTEIKASLFSSFAVGFLLSINVYTVLFAISKFSFAKNIFSNDKKENRIIKLLFSSFGGGNRGNLLVLTAFGTQHSIGSDVIKHFVILDLGNLISIISYIFFMIKLSTNSNNLKISLHKLPFEIIKTPLTYVMLIVILQLPEFKNTYLSNALENAGVVFDNIYFASLLSMSFSTLIFLSVFIRMENASQLFKNIKNIIYTFLAARITTVFIIDLTLYFFNFPKELIIATSVLTLMPPSSLVWTKILQSSPSIPESSKREAVYLIPIFIYFIFLSIAFVWGLLVH